jgi:hypothetical protein
LLRRTRERAFDFDSFIENNQHDADNNLTSKIDRKGQTSTYL